MQTRTPAGSEKGMMHRRFGQELGGALNVVVISFKTETASVMEDGQNVVTRGRELIMKPNAAVGGNLAKVTLKS